MEVAEGRLSEPPRGILPDPLEDAVAHIVEEDSAEAGRRIGRDQRYGDRRRGLHSGGHPVDRRAVSERHDQRGDADRDDDQQQREDDARSQRRLARWP